MTINSGLPIHSLSLIFLESNLFKYVLEVKMLTKSDHFIHKKIILGLNSNISEGLQTPKILPLITYLAVCNYFFRTKFFVGTQFSNFYFCYTMSGHST